MSEIAIAQSLIYSTLVGDPGLTALLNTPTSVYADAAPQGSECPYIVYQFIPGMPEERFETEKALALAPLLFLCKAISQGNDQTIATTIASRMGTLLEGIRQVNQSAFTWDGFRRSLFHLPLFEEGIRYTQSGGYYVLQARPPIG